MARSAPPATAPDVLTNGRYALLLTARGGGYAAFDGFALTRWSPDPLGSTGGLYVYLRDLADGRVWSIAAEPVPAPADDRSFERTAHGALWRRRDAHIVASMDAGVAADHDLELRRITLHNAGGDQRAIEVTTYAEVALDRPAALAAHPAFSNLFVQTGVEPALEALLAWRRLRSPDDVPLWLIHRLVVAEGAAGDADWETDRARFIGRGRTLAAPAALDGAAALSGTVGNVLDPVVSLRRVVSLPPGGSATLVAALGAGRTHDDVLALGRAVEDGSARERMLAQRAGRGSADDVTLGMPSAWRESLEIMPASGDGDDAPAAARRPAAFAGGAVSSDEELLCFNGHGGFTRDGTEYVVRIEPGAVGGALPPQPWVNVIANESAGVIASERGALHTWTANSRENRLTPWYNDPVRDPHGEAFYIRDEEAGDVWSPTPGPMPAAASYEVRHGFGRTRYRTGAHGLEQETTVFVPRDAPARIVRVSVRNGGPRPRRLSLYGYARLVLGVTPADTAGRVATRADDATGALLATNPERGEFSGRVAFAAVAAPDGARSFTTDRAAFLGPHGAPEDPAAARAGGALDGALGLQADPCAAWRVEAALAPGATFVCAFLLGEAASEEEARAIVRQLASIDGVDRALDDALAAWHDLIDGVRVATPAPAIDLMVNGWLPYQNLSCRLRGRTAFYQSGGAFGFRDQLQDAAALLPLDAGLLRRQILLHAAHQFVEGDVLHWWHPPASKGIRTRFADDLLWLPWAAAGYIAATGDAAVLDEEVRFVTARPLAPGEDEVFLFVADSGERGTVYEHCCRALDRSLTSGAHGLPLMGTGDWNDGMNRVGREGRGESVWLGFFLFAILEDFIALAGARGDDDHARRWRAFRAQLHVALNDAGWDGDWYRRAYYDDGTPLGAATSDECRIDTIAQAWAVLSGAAPADRAERALDAMERHLVSEDDGIIRLLTPAFDRTPHDPGYIKGYLPGVRENGGQYTHGALWGVRALAAAGRRDRAARLLEMISPVRNTESPGAVAVYRAEPYVIAADVYGVPPHVGRGGWTWYTGSAGWMYRVALESILGFELRRGDTIALRPCIPDDWPGFEIRYRVPGGGTRYVIAVTRAEAGVAASGDVDGAPLVIDDGAALVRVTRDGREHRVRLRLGDGIGPRYRQSLL